MQNSINIQNLSPFTISNKLIQLLGLSCAAFYTVVVNEVVAKTESNIDNPNEVCLSIKDFINKIGISKHHQVKHRIELQNRGILKVELKGLPAKLYYTIDAECKSNLEKLLLS